MNYEISKVLTLSTGHIPEGESELAPDLCTIDPQDYGWWFYISTSSVEAWPGQFKEAPVLLSLLKLARRLGCRWLCLDCDGQQRDDLPFFEW